MQNEKNTSKRGENSSRFERFPDVIFGVGFFTQQQQQQQQQQTTTTTTPTTTTTTTVTVTTTTTTTQPRNFGLVCMSVAFWWVWFKKLPSSGLRDRGSVPRHQIGSFHFVDLDQRRLPSHVWRREVSGGPGKFVLRCWQDLLGRTVGFCGEELWRLWRLVSFFCGWFQSAND